MAATLVASMTLTALEAPAAQAQPEPPCAVDPQPPYPVATATAAARIWKGAGIAGGWIPPACTGWTPSGFRTIVGLAARFRHDGGAEALLMRFAAVSSWTSIRYWSMTDRAPRALLADAAALGGPESSLRRGDFSVEEMKAGQDLYLSQVDTRSAGSAIYRMRVLERGANRVVVGLENVSPIRAFRVTLFHPGDLQSVYFLDRLEVGVWGYYSLAATRDSASLLTGGHEASFINRAAALFEHFAGLPAFSSSPGAR